MPNDTKQTPAALQKRIRQLEKCLAEVRKTASACVEAMHRNGMGGSLASREFADICHRINRTLK